MAWIRAALALMALGFVIDRFGLVVRQMMTQPGTYLHPNRLSMWGGTLLAGLGALMAATAAVRYLLFALRYHRRGSTRPGHGLYMGVFFAFLVALMGLAIGLSIVWVTL